MKQYYIPHVSAMYMLNVYVYVECSVCVCVYIEHKIMNILKVTYMFNVYIKCKHLMHILNIHLKISDHEKVQHSNIMAHL